MLSEVNCVQASDIQSQYWKYHYCQDNIDHPEVFISTWQTLGLKIEVLENTVKLLATRHDALRCFFAELEDKIIIAVKTIGDVSVEVEVFDLSNKDEQKTEEDILRIKVKQVCDLKNPPLFRIYVCKWSDGRSKIYMVLHHIIADAISIEILKSEINRIYGLFCKGTGDEFGPYPGQLVDYCRYQVKHSIKNKLRHERFWKHRFETILRKAYPWDWKVVINMEKGSTRSFTYILEHAITLELANQAKSAGCSFWSLVYGSLSRLFYHVWGREGIVVTSTVMDRGLRNGMSIIGNLVGSIYLYIQAYPNDHFSKLMREIHMDFVRTSRYLIFDHNSLESTDSSQLRYVCDLFTVFEPYISGTAQNVHSMKTGFELVDRCYYPLTFTAIELSDCLAIKWVFHDCFYTPFQIKNMAEKHIEILKEIVYGK